MEKKRILIVDDEPEMVMNVQARLEANGYEVLSAQDGQVGLALAKEKMPDLLILDVMMPKMDGYKVCGLLKADSRYKNIPILMFTARAQESDAQMSRDVGAEAYINKPFDSVELLKKIQELLGEQK